MKRLKTISKKKKKITNWHLLPNDQNAETILLHSHDEKKKKVLPSNYHAQIWSVQVSVI